MVDEYIGPAPEQPPQIEYTWEILNIQTQSVGNTSDIVVNIDWKKIGTLNNVSAYYVGASNFPVSMINANVPFKPLNEVTKDDVVKWVRATIEGAFESVVDMRIAEQINAIQSPIISVELPWLKANTSNTESSQ